MYILHNDTDNVDLRLQSPLILQGSFNILARIGIIKSI